MLDRRHVLSYFRVWYPSRRAPLRDDRAGLDERHALIHDLARLPPTALAHAWVVVHQLVSAGGVATVDGKGDAYDEAGALAAKPQHGPCDLVSAA